MTHSESLLPVVPNDTKFNRQPHLNNVTGGINATNAWAVTTGSPDLTVAILDTGELRHKDVTRRQAGYDFISDIGCSLDRDGRDSNPEDQGDGLHVSGCPSCIT